MATTELEILERAEATSAAMLTLADKWTWEELSPGGYAARIRQAREAGTEELARKSAYNQQRIVVDARFDELETRKVQGLGMAKIRYRRDANKLVLVEAVGEYGDTREAILKESEEWAAAWEKLDPKWSPFSLNSLSEFHALMDDCIEQLSHMTGLRADWRKAGVAHNALLAELADLNMAWFAAATQAFPESTPDGDWLRGQIPAIGETDEE